jgi:hypothetical protein
MLKSLRWHALVGLVLRMEEGMYGTTASFLRQRHASAARVDPAAGIGDLGLARLRRAGASLSLQKIAKALPDPLAAVSSPPTAGHGPASRSGRCITTTMLTSRQQETSVKLSRSRSWTDVRLNKGKPNGVSVATLYRGGARSWLQVRQRWPSPAATY